MRKPFVAIVNALEARLSLSTTTPQVVTVPRPAAEIDRLYPAFPNYPFQRETDFLLLNQFLVPVPNGTITEPYAHTFIQVDAVEHYVMSTTPLSFNAVDALA